MAQCGQGEEGEQLRSAPEVRLLGPPFCSLP